ncbi:MAG: glycoside hydrolase family 2 TIM barrel-domain containing protein [Eubacteriales bacterium]|nr:glycoside hydrolase family 2 TIM barrel-domain containing protein [Eubacteriales bacterium]
MKRVSINRGWEFDHGMRSGFSAIMESETMRTVDLPHDYMIESEVREDAPAGPASGFYTEGVAYYSRKVEIPAEWKGQEIYLVFDGAMMNATLEINGSKAALHHYGYTPMITDITPYIYYGKENRVTVTLNPGTQPNSRWYSGAGILRSAELLHGDPLHIVEDGIFGYTEKIVYAENGDPEYALVKSEISVENLTHENRLAQVDVWLTEDDSDAVILKRSRKIQVNPGSTETAEIRLTVDAPMLWSAEQPHLYRLHAKVTGTEQFVTHVTEAEKTEDEAEVLFGIRTIEADTRKGLQINGKTVKLKGGCIHHDNGILGAVSLYDSEVRRIRLLQKVGFNAVRTSHNPPSKALLEACDRLGMYVFNEAFDCWGIMKQPGDYSLFFNEDWRGDLTGFVKRDRNHPSVVIWSTGNEIVERGGLNNGYTLAKQLADVVHALDSSRPVSNGICSFWNGLDDEKTEEDIKKMREMLSGEINSVQNVDFGAEDLSWEIGTEPFTNGLDIVGYNYMEDKYPKDHELFPERIILGSENYPKEIGKRWPMVESTPYVIGDFTWTAFDYIGEAGIGKSLFVEKDDPRIHMGPMALMSHGSAFPWRLANDADIDINGNILPQGDYRSVVWGSKATHLYSYDPDTFDLVELLSSWGFTAGVKNWNWKNKENHPVKLLVFSSAEEVEVLVNGVSLGRKKQGEARTTEDLPLSFVFETVYTPGEVVAISYNENEEVSRDRICTVGEPAELRLVPETMEMKADGSSLAYVGVEIVDADGNVVPDAEIALQAEVSGAAGLAGFGSANPITAENYTSGSFHSYRGRALAVLRSKYESGETVLTVKAEGVTGLQASISLKVTE